MTVTDTISAEILTSDEEKKFQVVYAFYDHLKSEYGVPGSERFDAYSRNDYIEKYVELSFAHPYENEPWCMRIETNTPDIRKLTFGTQRRIGSSFRGFLVEDAMMKSMLTITSKRWKSRKSSLETGARCSLEVFPVELFASDNRVSTVLNFADLFNKFLTRY